MSKLQQNKAPLLSKEGWTRFVSGVVPCVAFLLFTIHCSLFTAQAQTATATLSGVVEDQNGQLVPGAAITIQNKATSLERTATTNDSGQFTVPLLPPGTYSVLVRRDGFTQVEVSNVVLNVGDQKSMRVGLRVGDVNAVVDVRPDESLIDTSQSVSTTVNKTFVQNLPLNGRSFQSLIYLTPGIVPTFPIPNNPGEFSVNGQRANANYFTLDGVSANTGITTNSGVGAASNALAGMLPALSATGNTTTLVSIDALEEYKVQTSTYSADLGRQPGGQVQLVSRSGSNQFHGTGYDYIRNEAFEARNWFNVKPQSQPPLRQNQFGVTFGGPVLLPRFGESGEPFWVGRDKTFFFFAYEGQRLRLPVFAQFAVPSLSLRQDSRLSPQLRKVLNAFPLPTGPEVVFDMDSNPSTSPTGSGGALFRTAYSNPRSLDTTSIRIDQIIGSKHKLFGRYNHAPSNSLSRNLAQLWGSAFESDTFTAGATSAFGLRVSNELRFNYTRNRAKGTAWSDAFGGAVPIEASDLLSGYSGPLNQAEGRLSFRTRAGGGEIFLGDNFDSFQRQFNVVDNVLLTIGTHQLKLGFDYRRLAPIFGPIRYRQATSVQILSENDLNLFISSGFVGQSGRVEISTRGESVFPRFDNFSAYVHDTWTVSPRLTLNLGLRWELNPAPTEASNRKPVLVTDVENLPAARLAQSDETWFKTSYTAFAPRFGFAYQLGRGAGRETVLRGGLGFYYDLNSGEASAAYNGFPFVASRSLTGVNWPLTSAQAALPAQPSLAPPILDVLFAIDPDLKLPRSLQWNLGLEQSLGSDQTITVSYVASSARNLVTTQALNQRIGGQFSGPRPNPNFAQINYIRNGPTADYHSFQAQYQRRFSNGFQALANYTWSHAIDEVSNEVQQGVMERGNANFDVRHNFSAALTYDLPGPKGVPLLSALLRGWSVDSTMLAMSGQPLDIFVSGGRILLADGSFVSVRPDLVQGQNLWVADSRAPGRSRINPAAFALPPLSPTSNYYARQGTLGRNVVVQPARHQVNLALRRQIKFGERWTAQIKGEIFNLFNHPLFSEYATSFSPDDAEFFGIAQNTLNGSSSGPGTSLGPLYQLGGPRSMQFSFRLSF